MLRSRCWPGTNTHLLNKVCELVTMVTTLSYQKIHKNLLFSILLLIPKVGYGFFGKILYIYFLIYQNLRIKASLVIFFFLISIATLISLIIGYTSFSYYLALDVLILINLYLLLVRPVQQSEEKFDYIIFYLLFALLIQICIGFFTGKTGIVKNGAVENIRLGFGTASASIVFCLMVVASINTGFGPLKKYTIVILSFFGLIVSGGRTPLFVALLIFALNNPSKYFIQKVITLCVVLSLFYLSGFYQGILERSGISSLSEVGSGISTTGRLIVWTEAIEYLGYDRWIDFKPGNISEVLNAIRVDIGFAEDQFHSELIRMYATYGYFGVAIYTYLLAKFTYAFLFLDGKQYTGLTLALLLIGLTDNSLVYFHFWFLVAATYKNLFIKCK